MDKLLLAKLLGKYIHEKRLHHNMTQSQLAGEMGFTAQFLGRIENGVVVPSKRVLRKLIRILDLDANRIRKIFRSSTLNYVEELYQDFQSSDFLD